MSSASSSTERSTARISVVIPSLNEGDSLRSTVERFQATLPEESEIVVVDDGSTDNSADFLVAAGKAQKGISLLRTQRLGAARARNHGARRARGEVLVFSDAHIETPDGWCQPLLEALSDASVGAVSPVISVMGQTTIKGYGLRWKGPDLGVEWLGRFGRSPYPVPLLPGGFLAMRRSTFQACGHFDSGMIHYGSEDTELSLRLWLLGYRLLLVPQVDVVHLFRRAHPYAVDWTVVLHNMLRVAFAHFSPARISRVVEMLKGYRDFSAALSLTVASDIWKRRAGLARRRAYDDDWFFNCFGMTC